MASATAKPPAAKRPAAPMVEMTGNQIINMLLSVRNIEQATVAILEFEDYSDRRARLEGLDPKRVRRGIVSRVTKGGATKRKTLDLLNQAQDDLVKKKKAVGAARFDGTYVKELRLAAQPAAMAAKPTKRGKVRGTKAAASTKKGTARRKTVSAR